MDGHVQVERGKGKDVVLMNVDLGLGSTMGIMTTTTSSSMHMHSTTTTPAHMSSLQPTINSLPEELIERILELCVASPPFMPARPEWHQGGGVCRKGGEKGSPPPRSRTLPCITVAAATLTTDTKKTGSSSQPQPVIRTRLAPLLVNKRFNRIGTPLFYGTVLVRHEAQAKALGEVLWGSMRMRTGGVGGGLFYNEDLGRFIHTLILGGSWEEGAGVVGACAVYSDGGGGGGVKRLDLTVTNSGAGAVGGVGVSCMRDSVSTAATTAVPIHPYRRQTLLEVLPKLRNVKHLTLRKGGGNTYLTQKKVGDVVRSVARGVRSWSGLEMVCIAFKMSDDSLGTGAAVAAVPGAVTAATPPAMTSTTVNLAVSTSASATRTILPPTLGAIPTAVRPPGVVIPSGRGQGQRSNSTPSRYLGSGGVLPLIRTNVGMSTVTNTALASTSSSSSVQAVGCSSSSSGMMNLEKMKASSFESSVFPSPASSSSDAPDSAVYPRSQDHNNSSSEMLDLDLDLPRELDSAGPCTILAWAVANCVSKKLHTVVTHTPSVWNGVLVRIVEGRERYLSELGGGVGGLKRVVLVDPNMFGGMDDFAFLGRAFGAGLELAGDDEHEGLGEDGVVVGGGGLQRCRGDTFSMAYQSPGIRSPWGFANSPTVINNSSTPTPMSPMMPCSPRSPGFGGAGGRGGLFRHGAKDHPKLATLIRKGDVWLGRLGGGWFGGEVGVGVGRGGAGPSSFGLTSGYSGGSGGGLNIGGVRTRAYTMGSTSSGMSG